MCYRWELKKAAKIVVEEMINLRMGETVLIYADTATDERVVEGIAEAAYIAGGVVSVFWYETRREVDVEPPPPLAAAMKAADVIIELAKKYLIHTKAYYEALQGGARSLCLTGMTAEMMVRCIGNVNYRKLVEFGNILTKILEKGKEMHITTPAGTDVVLQITDRPIFHNSGVVTNPGEQTFLGGQISWAPVEETINGTIVFDGSVWPPEWLGILKTPIILKVKSGEIKSIEGGFEARKFKKWLESFDDRKMFKIAHISYGFNPGAKLTGKILEDERVFGCIEVGIGSQSPRFAGKVGPAKAHTDGIMLNPTVILDGKLIEEEGEFVEPKLLQLISDLIDRKI